MECMSPIILRRSDGEFSSTKVPCGKCLACLSNKRKMWRFRLEQELKGSISAFFVTLTYDDDHLYFNDAGVPSVSKRDIQLFLKRLRKFVRASFRYFCVAEYGGMFHRPHYHMLIFNIDSFNGHLDYVLSRSWKNGFVHVGDVTAASINYCAKYVVNSSYVPAGADKVFSLMSRRPGIGSSFLTDRMEQYFLDRNSSVITLENGVKTSLPRYYKDKIFGQYKPPVFRSNKVFGVDPKNFKSLSEFSKAVFDAKNDYVRRLNKIQQIKGHGKY